MGLLVQFSLLTGGASL